jgi:regulator of replication initiation timing
MNDEDLRAEIEDLKAEIENLKAEKERLRMENEALKKSTTTKISMKVSQKGALSVYGLGRFPVTLYKEQWFRLLEKAEDIRTFIKENDSELKGKS